MTPLDRRTMEQWREAADDLGFTFVGPFRLEEAGETLTYLGCLPQFGSERGMLIITDPSLEQQCRLTSAAAGHGFAYSCMSASDEPYDREATIEVLRDWSWTSSDSPPVWCRVSRDATSKA